MGIGRRERRRLASRAQSALERADLSAIPRMIRGSLPDGATTSPMVAHLASLLTSPVWVRTWALEGCSGDFCSQSRTIRLARGLSPGAAVDVLIHELGHAAEDDLELATSAARIAGSAWDPYARRVYRYSPACGAEYAGEALGTEVVSTGVELIAGAASRGNLRLLLAGCRGAQATYVARAIF